MLEDSMKDLMSQINQLSSLEADDTKEYFKQLKNFRVAKNLGSRIKDVQPFIHGSSGFAVTYSDGDICLADSNRRY